MLSCFGIHAADSNEMGLFKAVLNNELEAVARFVETRAVNFNYTLNERDVEFLKKDLNKEDGIELGITPLLCALSVENLDVVNLLLQDAKKLKLNVNMTNGFNISAVHMLAMVRLDKNDESQLLTILDQLVYAGFNNFGNFSTTTTPGITQNLIVEAIRHNKPCLGQKLVERGAPIPDMNSDIYALQHYLTNCEFDESFLGRRKFLREFLQSNNVPAETIERITGRDMLKAMIKTAAGNLTNDLSKIQEFNRFLKEIIVNNPQLCKKDFEGFLVGFGSSLPDSTKRVLRFEADA